MARPSGLRDIEMDHGPIDRLNNASTRSALPCALKFSSTQIRAARRSFSANTSSVDNRRNALTHTSVDSTGTTSPVTPCVTASVVADREIIMTTTNGTRALSACRGAAEILAASFSNIGAVAAYLTLNPPSQLLLICSGTLENASFEDALGAGALVDRLWPLYGDPVKARPDDSAAIVRSLFQHHQSNLLASARLARNGRRLLAVPQLAPDLPLCMDLDRLNLVARVDSDGILRVIDSQSEN